jgi:hypothetical protein
MRRDLFSSTAAELRANSVFVGLSGEEVAALGLAGLEAGAHGFTLKSPDGKVYSLALRPLLPDERS